MIMVRGTEEEESVQLPKGSGEEVMIMMMIVYDEREESKTGSQLSV